MEKKVFIVDDHVVVIEGIRSLLQSEEQIHWMGHATTLEECRSFLKHSQPDIILMDISLPDGSGIELCKEVKANYPYVFIIGLSTFNQQSFIQKMMDNGASGYLLKNATRNEIVEALDAVSKGETYLSFEAANSLRKEAVPDLPVLTRREKEILNLIADGLTNNEIAQKLYLSIGTVDTHRKNLLAKFGTRNIASLIKMAMQWQLLS